MLLLIIVLAFAAGYYQSALEVEQRKNQRLQQKIEQLQKPTIETEN
jgi:arginine utilization protein RocB